MKKNYVPIITTLILSVTAPALCMPDFNDPHTQQRFAEAAQDIANDAERSIRNIYDANKYRKEDIRQQLQSTYISEQRKNDLRNELDEIQATEDRNGRLAEQGFGLIMNVYGGLAQAGINRINAENELRQTAVQADMQRRGNVEIAAENTRQYIAALRDPETLKRWGIALGGTSALIFASWHGTKLLANYLSYLYRNPVLAEETSLLTPAQKLLNYIQGTPPLKTNIKEVIFEKNLAQQVERLAYSVQNTVKSNTYFKNILFYGPPGTGKTMISKRIARSSGLEYIYFSGSSIDQFSLEEGLMKLVELFEFAKKSSKKLAIIIDEAEVLFANRAKELSDKSRKLLNLLLTYTGSETKDYMVVALTNRIEDLDSAFINRCDEHIKVGAPALEQRKDILKLYIQEFLIDFNAAAQIPAWKQALGFKQDVQKLNIDKRILADSYLLELAKKLDRFVGREISKLVLSIQSAALLSSDLSVTKQLIDSVVDQKIKQKESLAQR